MTEQESTPSIKKVHTPKPTVNSFQASYIESLMKAKGYASKEHIAQIITKLSSVSRFGEITFDEARYLISRLPRVHKRELDLFMDGKRMQKDVGIPPYRPNFKPTRNKFLNRKGGKA